MKIPNYYLRIKLHYNKLILFYYNVIYGFFKGKNVHLIGNITIYKRVIIGDNSTITTGNKGKIDIRNNCSLGKNLWLGSGDGSITIGKECLFGPNVTIVSQNHSVSLSINASNYLPWDRDSEPYDTIIGERCHIGANVVVLPGTIIGDYCTVGANTVLNGNFEPGSLIVGNPARVVKTAHINFSIPNTTNFIFPPHRHLSKKFF